MTSKSVYIGVDPGTTGAIAVLCGNSLTVHDIPLTTEHVGRTDRTRVDMSALYGLVSALALLDPVCATIEKVGGVQGQGGSQSFIFGFSVGLVHMAFAAAGVEVRTVHPIKWKNVHRVPGKRAGKDKARALAAQLWPDCAHLFARVKDADRAEAALIADYSRRADA